MNDNDKSDRNRNILQNFITNLHRKEVTNGQIRETLYDIIFNIDNNSPIVYKTVLTNTPKSKPIPTNDCIVHCRCGSFDDETSLVQCYACLVRKS